ncbi:MAG: PAS domain S-box protein [Lentisphaerales bacterium]|nr:PAS domain S-box protein [Lentisphaerales bacterium]
MFKKHTICLSTALILFIIDINIIGVAGSVPYILLVFIALKNDQESHIYLYASLGSLLTVLGYVFSPQDGEQWKVLTNRSLALFAIWLTAIVCIRLIKSIQDLKIQSKVLEQSPNAIIICNNNGTIQYVNNAFSEITGFSGEEAIGQNQNFLNSDKNSNEVTKEMWAHLNSKQAWQGDLLNNRKSGEEVWIHLNISPIVDSRGDVSHYVSTEQDISKIRSSESELIKSEKRLRDLVEATPMCIHEIDKNGKLCSMNSAGLGMMGVESESEIIGLDYCSLPNKEKQATIKQMMQEAFKGKTSFFEFSIINDQDEELFFESCFRPIVNADGSIEKLMGISQNISERKKADLLIAKALEDSKESNRVKEEFLSVVSHELRTPMNGIFGGLGIIRDEINKESFEILYRSSIRMMTTIDDILSFISLSRKSAVLNLIEFDINNLQKTLTKRVNQISVLEDKNTDLDINWNNWSGLIHCDFNLLENIIWNLLSNSLKFTTHGEINLSAELTTEKLIIDIDDSGCGINEEQQSIIFKEFKQADSSINRQHEGLGIGLALSLKQVDLLGGKLALVSSSIDSGTHFRIEIPI